MIRRKEDVNVRKVTNAQNGNGDVFFHDWLLAGEAANHGRVFSKLVVPSGSSIGYHQHIKEFEAIYVLEGVATVNENGKEELLYPGDMSLCRDGESHSLTNNGESDLVVIALIMDNLENI